MIFCIFLIAFIILPIVILSLRSTDSSGWDYKTSDQFDYDKVCKIANKGHSANTSETAQKHLDELYSMRNLADFYGYTNKQKAALDYEIAELKDTADDMKRSEWEEKANKVLDDFLSCFLYVTNQDEDIFYEAEEIIKSSKRCIKLWHKYWSLLDDVCVNVNAKMHFANHLMGDFEPCMLESGLLKKRLDEAVENAKPEIKRKKKICSDLLELVAARESIMRSELLKCQIKNASPEEVRFCYKNMLSAYMLVEYKIGSRYFVSLSDKEKTKLTSKQNRSNETIQNESNTPAQREQRPEKAGGAASAPCSAEVSKLKKRLEEAGKLYVDKTPFGGCLWVAADQETDAMMKDLTINGNRPRYVQSAKTFGGDPGWYIMP